MTEMLIQGIFETLLMVGVSAFCGFILGTPIAVGLWMTGPEGLTPKPWLNRILSIVINASRSIPYIIFMVLLIPVTRMLVGSAIGTIAATVPLSLAAVLLFTRLAEEVFQTIPKGLIEAGRVMGGTSWQIIRTILFDESLPQLLASVTTLTVMLIGFSAMAGAIGGGGLGDLAIRYGYQRYDLPFLIAIVLVLIVMVQCVQVLGDYVVKTLRK